MNELPAAANGAWRIAEIERQTTNEERNRSLVARPEPNREENGDIVFA